MKVDVKIKKLHKDAKIPVYAHDTDAGADLYSIDKAVIPPGATAKIGTGLSVEIPEGYEWQIRPRSGFSFKRKLMVVNSPGTVDAGYRGEVGILLINPTNKVIKVEKGERIAQAVLKEVPQANFIVVDELVTSDRGEGGFGSTGTTDLMVGGKDPSREEFVPRLDLIPENNGMEEEPKTVDMTQQVAEECGESTIKLGVEDMADPMQEYPEEDPEVPPMLDTTTDPNEVPPSGLSTSAEEPKEEELVEGAVALIDGEETKSVMEVDTSSVTNNDEVISKVQEIDKEISEELSKPEEEVSETKPLNTVGDDTIDRGAYGKYAPMVDQAIEAFLKTDENKALYELAIDEVSLEDIKTKVIFRIVDNRIKNQKTIIVNELKEVLDDIVVN